VILASKEIHAPLRPSPAPSAPEGAQNDTLGAT
jgi:hypothetical protein